MRKKKTFFQQHHKLGDLGVPPLLVDVKYFERDRAQGLVGVSFAGGAELLITGQEFSHYPSDNYINYFSSELQGSAVSPKISNSNEFHSDIASGKLQYTTPALDTLFYNKMTAYNKYESLFLELSVLTNSANTMISIWELKCTTTNNCIIPYSRGYTPLVYYLSPQVVYFGAQLGMWVNPQATQSQRTLGIDLPFVEARLDGSLLDFEDYYDENSELSAYNNNQILGLVGDQEPNANSNFQIKFISGYGLHQDYSMKTCLLDGTTCYKAKTVPKIDSISYSSGYVLGGQLLEISGYGFRSKISSSVIIGDVPCTIISQTLTKIICQTGVATAVTIPNTLQPGSNGLRRRVWNATDNTELFNGILMHFEPPVNQDQYGAYGQKITGYFKAPATGRFRFYLSADDTAILKFSTTPNNPSTATQIAQITSYSAFRNYWRQPSSVSVWFTLTQDQYYYIEATHSESSGGDHISVAVEFEQVAITDHQQTIKEVKQFQINPVNIREETTISIVNPDNGNLTFTFTAPKTAATFVTDKFKASGSASDLQTAIQGYFSQFYSAQISVVLVSMQDSTGALTNNATLSAKNVFKIILLRQISGGQSFVSFIVSAKQGTSSYMTVDSQVKGSEPLRGSFSIIGTSLDGSQQCQTDDIPYNSAMWAILQKIVQACPEYRDIDIWDGTKYTYYDDGRELYIRFKGFNQDIQQFIITNGVNTQLSGSSISYQSLTSSQFSTNLFYTPIPFDWLFTNELLPQVQVTIDDLPAACVSLSCSYSYIANAGDISTFSLSALTLTIVGTGLPTGTDLISITYGNALCIPNSSSTTRIVCDLSTTPVAGLGQTPKVRTTLGYVPVSATPQDINFSISSVTGISSNLNPNGNSVITFTGTNFPLSLTDGSTVSVIFSQDSNQCFKISVSSTQLSCKTQSFITKDPSILQTIIVTINGQINNLQTCRVDPATAKVSSFSPSQLSPVLKTKIDLQLTGFALTLNRDDFRVFFYNQDNSLNKEIRVVSVDDTNKKIKIAFSGAPSDTYVLQVTHNIYGDIDTTLVTLITEGRIISYTPSLGSINGGTNITITGHTFSDDYLDNNVRIGRTDCLVLSSSATQIVCRTEPKVATSTNVEPVLVFLKAAEESVCNAGLGQCNYQWIDTGLPEISSFTTTYDSANGQWTISIIGTGFTGTSSSVELYIDGIQQTVTSVSSTVVVAQITNLKNSSSTDVNLFFPIGSPNKIELLQTGLQIQPKLTQITPNTGSPAGSIIQAIVKGLGSENTGIDLVNSAGVSICNSVLVTAFETVQCKTKEATVASGQISFKIGANTYGCANSDLTQCLYSTSSSMPVATSQSVSVDRLSIEFIGTNFLASGYNGKVKFLGVQAGAVVIYSNTLLTATFNQGVPNHIGEKPEIWFESISNQPIAHWTTVSTNLVNDLTISDSQSGVQCSFAGGCELSIDGLGLASTLQNTQRAEISVCGETCELEPSLSSSSKTKCLLPSLQTIYSADSFKITQPQYLSSFEVIGSNLTQAQLLFDDNNMNGWIDVKTNCYFGAKFRSGYMGVISEVKYFMNRFSRLNYIGVLKFQGSNDGTTFDDIFTVQTEIHEGWNYYPFPAGQEKKYNQFRFFGSIAGSCVVGEMKLKGVEVYNDNNPTIDCTPQVIIDGKNYNAPNTVQYRADKTAKLTSISPRWGTVKGGETITLTGENFSSSYSLYTIKIDGKTCTPISSTLTEVKCVTGSRPGLIDSPPTLSIYITGLGNVATQGLVFRYVSYWSDPDTWGGEFEPLTEESIYIPPGLHLLVDVDETAVLQAVIVEGSLIFPPHPTDPNHLRQFSAHYVFIRNGYMEVGTEDFPYTSKLIITMYGYKYSPEIPIYGNKVIGVRNGILDMHGVKRTPTWTELDTTANAGATSITLKESADWKVGETIVIAATGYYHMEAEERVIAAVNRNDPNKTVISFVDPLLYKHYAGIQNFGTSGDFIEMRAEVGLLSRNVIYRGDPATSNKNQFGAHIMLHSHGDESLIGRIEYVELTDVGQAFQLGRYPIHFHMIGTVHQSYVKGNALHRTYNRACTIHHVHYLRVTENVAYDTMGHTFFIEDAIETKNFLYHNLAIRTQRSWSLLNTDQSPASFWITHPDNIFRNNHAAGSDRYGFWFDLKNNPLGPSFDPNICPKNAPLGEFSGNVAHSNVRYGLRIFHGIEPRLTSCEPISATNPSITAEFRDFTGYKNQRNGAIFEKVGDVRCINFKTADNLLAGIEYSLSGNTPDGTAQINGAVIIGHSENADPETMGASPHGIITPRTEGFQVNNVNFYNFDQNNMAALGSCSHCFHPAATDSGARTVTFSGLYFDLSVTKKIRYQFPWRAIYHDTDGTLTGLGADTWATPYWKHNVQPECQTQLNEYDGLICNSTVQVRRIAFYKYTPQIFDGMEMKIVQWDDTILNAKNSTELDLYLKDENNYSIVPFKPKLDPANGWAMPYVTNHKYKIHWRNGLDFMTMQMTPSQRWQPTDKSVHLTFNFTDIRAMIEFKIPGLNSLIVPNETLTTKAPADYETGDNIVYNDTATRQFHVVVNGKNSSKNDVTITGYRCVGACSAGVTAKPIETIIRLWSVASSWDFNGVAGHVPLVDEDVVIQPGWNMFYDLADSPVFKLISVNGRLTFQQDANHTLRAKHIFVRAGELVIGSETEPFRGYAKIILVGDQQSEHIVYTNAVEAGNKVIANTGIIRMYGTPRSRMVRLSKPAKAGDKTIYVQLTEGGDFDWQAGDQIVLFPTSMNYAASDFSTIQKVNIEGDSNPVYSFVLEKSLLNYHFGQATSTGANNAFGGVDMRCEVFLLTRNIKIVGEDLDGWGGQIVTGDFLEDDGTQRAGHTLMDNVEIYNCSQRDTYKAALRFENTIVAWSKISNSAIHHGLGRGMHIDLSANILLVNNIFFDFSTIGVNIQTSNNITLNGNGVVHIIPRKVTALDAFVDPNSGYIICGFNFPDQCKDITVINNIAAGAVHSGFGVQGHSCGVYDNSFRNNIAHSINGIGAIIYPAAAYAAHATCFEGSYFTAYKNTYEGAFTYFESQEVRFSNMVLIDNGWSIGMMLGQEGDLLQIKMDHIKIFGETAVRDCDYQNQCALEPSNNLAGCIDKHAMVTPYVTRGGKSPYPRMKSALPLHKVKTDASWGSVTYFTNIEINGFKQRETWCGTTQSVFDMNPSGSDYHVPSNFNGIKFVDIHEDAMSTLMDPPLAWANLDDCGQFPCTGPQNLILYFKKATFSGSITPTRTPTTFQILSHNDKINNALGCTYKPTWNGHLCEQDDVSLLLIDSLDSDTMDRTVSPLIITSPSLPLYSNVVNSFMDHIWDGFYTGQKRMTRFPITIKSGEIYNLSYTGTPPGKQRFKLTSETKGITVQIRYAKAGAYQVVNVDTNAVYESNPWDDVKRQPQEIRGTRGCGENRFMGVVNILEFYLSPNCTARVEPKDLIMTKIRMDWTLNAFYADGGTTKFVDRLAASLGIHPSTIKVVAVYQGSVIIESTIVPPSTLVIGSDEAKKAMKTIEDKFNALVSDKKLDLGAPILDVTTNDVPVKINGADYNTNNSAPTNDKTNNTNQPQNPTFIKSNQTVNVTDQQYTVAPQDKKKDSMKQMLIMVGVIIGVIVIFLVVGYVIYKKCRKPQEDKVIKTIPNDSRGVSPDVKEDFDEEYEPQYHPKADLGKFFGIAKNKNYDDDVVVATDNEDVQNVNTSELNNNNASEVQNSVMNFHDESPMRGVNTVGDFKGPDDGGKELSVKAKQMLKDGDKQKSLSMKNVHAQQ